MHLYLMTRFRIIDFKLWLEEDTTYPNVIERPQEECIEY